MKCLRDSKNRSRKFRINSFNYYTVTVLHKLKSAGESKINIEGKQEIIIYRPIVQTLNISPSSPHILMTFLIL